MASKLFQTKSPELLIRESEAPDRKMKRSLNVLDLTCLGIGAIIGAGIFALAGTAAAGESAHVGESIVKTPVLNFIIAFVNHTALVFGRPAAGPAVAISFVVAPLNPLCENTLSATSRIWDRRSLAGMRPWVWVISGMSRL